MTELQDKISQAMAILLDIGAQNGMTVDDRHEVMGRLLAACIESDVKPEHWNQSLALFTKNVQVLLDYRKDKRNAKT